MSQKPVIWRPWLIQTVLLTFALLGIWQLLFLPRDAGFRVGPAVSRCLL